jgi:3-oxoacyl-[acyl-carrier protein] reductase
MELNQTRLFKGRTVLVTGAARGLGHDIASAFIQAEANVVKTDIVFEDIKQSVNETTMVSQENCLKLEMDVSSTEAIESAIEKIKERFGDIDILINNAAVIDRFALIENQSLDAWEKGINVNLSGAFRCIKSVWKDMIKNNWGRIINISSFTAESGSFGQPAYGAAKAGLQGLTRALALEGAKHQITVNAVLPGFIDTEALRHLQPEMLEKIKNQIAMKRFARPEEIADVVVFLASEASSYITGASIPITGGADLFTF